MTEKELPDMFVRNYLKETLNVIVFLSFFFGFSLVGNVSAAATITEEELLVTFNLKQIPMKNVIDMITTQTGYTVNLEEKLVNFPVSGEFSSVEVTSFFNQVLKRKNPFITISPKEKTITVRTGSSGKYSDLAINRSENNTKINDKSKIGKLGGIYELDKGSPPKVSNDNKHIIDSQTGKPWNEVEELLK